MEKRCGCKRHAEWGDDNLMKLSAKKVKKATIQKLISRNDISERTTYICKGCVTNCEDEATSNNDFDVFLGKIRNGGYNEENLCQIAEAVASTQKLDFSEEVNPSITDILNTDLSVYLSSKNDVLIRFLFAFTNTTHNSPKRQNLLLLAIAVDCIYRVIYPKYVTFLCLMFSMIAYVISGSKTVVKILSSMIPCGSYPTLRFFMKTMPNDCANRPPEGRDIFTFFDNNQIICKNWNIKYDSKCKVSVITTSIHLLPPDCTSLQQDPQLSPSKWLYHGDPIASSIEYVKDIISRSDTVFKDYRDSFISSLLEKCHQELSTNQKNLLDLLEYNHVPNMHKDGKTTVFTGDPLFLNPCSYTAVKEVLKTLHAHACEGPRCWSIMGCDGLPYVLGSRKISEQNELQDILLIPGLGHYEINMTKSCFKLLWNVCLEDLAKMMGFRTIRALTCCQKASDHHKSFQLLIIIMNSFSFELSKPYVQSCIDEDILPSVAGFYKFISKSDNANYRFFCETVYTYLLSLFLFRAGMRVNNSEAMLAGRIKFSPLFFGLNQTFYQEIEMKDLICRARMPVSVRKFIEEHETFTVSGIKTKGEGGDFILEAKNKKIQRMMPPGLPSDDKWREVCRNADTVDKVREVMNSLIGIEDQPAKSHILDLKKEIQMLRNAIIESGYFEGSGETPTSLSGKKLDQSLVDFSANCKGNRAIYLEELAAGKPFGKTQKVLPVFITPNDRDKYHAIENKTKGEIESFILTMMDQIREKGNTATAHYLRTIWEKEVKQSTKKSYLTFYNECVQALEDATDDQGTESDDDEEH